ncbi:RNA polymerase sigma factor [Roseivirga sp. E12]|uniref:RNA polymerase sigma factor n=1 Tax=Roseivirga sp. E12 TaxID=2819237 RepID=UPI001ABCABC1|nr:sigma-70 family RNA polymerase sigma factor [Roseivirga sp. E12]MBO3698724.1 sigma-70 family RNA polymerase sigma factor [Roseivirga sp. E12]
MSVNSLILRLRNGDRTALEDIYKKYRASFLKWITYTHKCTDDEAVDIFQYSILSFYENVLEESFEEMNEAGIKTYLYSIGKNKLLADSRKNSKISYQEEIDEDELFEVLEEDDSEKEVRLNKIKKLVSELGEPCSEILRLFYFSNLSNDEIAEVMRYKNGNTVKNLKYKCIQRIKNQL